MNYECWQTLSAMVTAIGTCVMACGTVVMALAILFTVFYAKQQVRGIRSQLERTGAHNRTGLSSQHNWALFEHHEKLPEALPSWVGLEATGWAWRVLHLNHLNLLLLAYEDRKAGLMPDDQDWEEWKRKANFWFQRLRTDSEDREIHEGRETLKQLLRPEEGYSKEFCQWLVEADIIPRDLVLR